MRGRESWSSLIFGLALAACALPRPGEISTTAVEADPALGARVDAAAEDALREIPAAGSPSPSSATVSWS